VLGAGWGAGAGAVVGNQVSTPGDGVAVGAGLGAVSGMMTGAGLDLQQSQLEDNQEVLDEVKLQNAVTEREIRKILNYLDLRAMQNPFYGVTFTIPFDVDATSPRIGALSQLDTFADGIKKHPGRLYVNVIGHADDGGMPDYAERLSEARARSVASYIASRGVSLDQIKILSKGSKMPILSNSTSEGRNLNSRVEVSVSQR
jgi:outer membrane protein OmpA-like peptidoglycan-associated protein